MGKYNYEETLSRTVKIAIDSGEVTTIEDAKKIFQGYHLAIEVGSDVATSPTLQVCLLSIVNSGRRAFLGGVYVSGSLGFDLLIPWKNFKKVTDAINDLQGIMVKTIPSGYPRIIIGNVNTPQNSGPFTVRATFDGWLGGVVPIDDGRRLPENKNLLRLECWLVPLLFRKHFNMCVEVILWQVAELSDYPCGDQKRAIHGLTVKKKDLNLIACPQNYGL